MNRLQHRCHVLVLTGMGLVALAGVPHRAEARGELWKRVITRAAINYNVVRAVTDASDNVIVLSTSIDVTNNVWSSRDFLTVKYSPSGTEMWRRAYEGPLGGGDIAADLAVDAAGNVIVTGNVAGNGGFADIATVKYAPDGAQLWAAVYDGPAGAGDSASGVAVDAAGNVYVAGAADVLPSGCGYNLQTTDFVTIKYGPAGGDPQWVRTYDGPGARTLYPQRGHQGCPPSMCVEGEPIPPAPVPYADEGDDDASDVRVDGAGNVYVTGASDGIPFGSCSATVYDSPDDCTGRTITVPCRHSDVATVKYSSAGAELWVARYDGAEHRNDKPSALGVDGSGNVFVTGSTLSTATAGDYLTVKYSAAGVEQWTRTYSGVGGARYDSARALVIDASGRVTVTGFSDESSQSGCGAPSIAMDIATVQYDANGTLRWAQRYSSRGTCTEDMGSALAVDASSNVVVAGKAGGGYQQGDFAVIKYNSSGKRLWVKTDAGGQANAVAIDAAGNSCAAGWGGGDFELHTLKYAP